MMIPPTEEVKEMMTKNTNAKGGFPSHFDFLGLFNNWIPLKIYRTLLF